MTTNRNKQAKTWLKIKVGLVRDPKHREAMAEGIWLYQYLIDLADWETGKVYDFKDEDCAADMAASVSWVRKWRRRLEANQYLVCESKGSKGQVITITNWLNPRSYSGETINPVQSDTNVTLDQNQQSVIESVTQSDTDSVTFVTLDHVQNTVAFTDHSSQLQSITPPNGAALDSVEKPVKERTPLEAAVITEIFGLPADTPFDAKQSRKKRGAGYLVGQIYNWIRREYPTHTDVEVRRFKVYYHAANQGAAMVNDLARFEVHYRRFVVALEKKNAAQAQQQTTPAKPPEPTREELLQSAARLEELRAQRKAKSGL